MGVEDGIDGSDSPLTKSKLRLSDNHVTIMDFYLNVMDFLKKINAI
jgi:hypothetical protein